MVPGHNSELRITLDVKHCELSPAEIEKLEVSLDPLREVSKNFPVHDLHVTVEHYPRTSNYRVKLALVLPGSRPVAVHEDALVFPAFDRCVFDLVRQIGAYKDQLDQSEERTKHLKHTHIDVLPTHDPDITRLVRAVEEGDYAVFRSELIPYEEPLEKHVGRWVERYPEWNAQIGTRVKISDVVEEVFLDAFEGYEHRPADVRFGQWLDHLIDPALKEIMRNPDAALENINMARTLQDTDLPRSDS